MDSTEIAGLLAKVKAATGPDRRLDYEIFTAFAAKDQSNIWDPKVGNEFTASIDPVVALIERVLPGATWVLAGPASHLGRNRASVTLSSPLRSIPVIEKGCATPGLSLIAALLTAIPGGPDAER